jgi:hypothetical protein
MPTRSNFFSKNRVLRALAAALLLGAPPLSASTAGSPPDLLNYSGRLVTPDGIPLGAGPGPDSVASYRAEFRIYDAPVGGNLLWSESQSITVDGGQFSVIIGEGDAIDGEPRPRLSAALAGPQTRHLGITVRFLESELPVEMSPRQPLLNAPYALLSSTAEKLLDASGNPLLSADGGTLRVSVPLTTTQPIVSASLSGSASGLSNLDASAINSGTLDAARLPASLPAASIASGVFPASLLPVVPASKITSLDASRITSGRLSPAVSNAPDSSIPASFAERQTFRSGITFPRNGSKTVLHQPLASNPVHLDPVWTTGWNLDLSTQSTLDSIPAFISRKIGHNQNSGNLTVEVRGPGTLRFDWMVSSEATHDRLRFFQNSQELTSISGSQSQKGLTYQVPSGSHTYSWIYTKDGSIDAGEDLGRVANILFTASTLGNSADTPAPHNLSLNRNPLLLRGPTDNNHFLAHGLDGSLASRWVSSKNGPLLVGFNGGALVTRSSNSTTASFLFSGSENWSLRWNATTSSDQSNIEIRNLLRIRPGTGSLATGRTYWAHTLTNAQRYTNATTAPIALTTPGSIAASSFISASDARIKMEIHDSSIEDSLRVIDGLEFVEYEFKDAPLDHPLVGLVAQQVRTLDPDAVTLSERFLPDILAHPVSIEWNADDKTITVALENEHALAPGDIVRLVLEEGTRDLPVAEVVSPTAFRVEGFDSKPAGLFVHGRQVDDFHTIELDRLFATGVVAVQEIQRRIDDSRTRLAASRARFEDLKINRAELLRVRDELRAALDLQAAAPAPSSPALTLNTAQP